MRVIVDGKEAVLKANSVFQYVAENPLFTDAEEYTFEMTFPLDNQPENILIFGALHVQGVDRSKIRFTCEMFDGEFYKSGFLTIIEANETEVKAQFLEGMSTHRYYNDVMNTYIDELDYSSYDGTDGTEESQAKASGQGWTDLAVWDKDADALFINEDSMDCKFRHIYLYHLIEVIAEICGFTVDMTDMEAVIWFKKVVIANTTSHVLAYTSYMQLDKLLPHWTIKELFKEVSRFFGCFIRIDVNSQKISFVKWSKLIQSTVGEEQDLTVNDDFVVEQNDSEKTIADKIKVRLSDDCDPLKVNKVDVEYFKNNVYVYYPLIGGWYSPESEALGQNTNVYNQEYLYSFHDTAQIGGDYEETVYITNIEERDEITTASYHQYFVQFEVLGQLGHLTEGEESRIVPCNMRVGRLRYIRFGVEHKCDISTSYDTPQAAATPVATPYKLPIVEIAKPKITRHSGQYFHNKFYAKELIEIGTEEMENKPEKLMVVLREGSDDGRGNHIFTRAWEPVAGENYSQGTITAAGGEEVPLYYSGLKWCRFNLTPAFSVIQSNMRVPNIDESLLYRFKFIGKTIPTPTKVFRIKGQKYACQRISAQFTNKGLSELMEGEFYRIID